MRTLTLALVLAMFGGYLTVGTSSESRSTRGSLPTAQAGGKPITRALQRNSLCAKNERIIFSCLVRRPAKIVSLCASKDLEKKRGYLQYRFGLPGKIDLEYPKDRQGTQEKFQYTHYMRALVDLTEINFQIDGYQYQIFDTYQGEEKPAITTQGVSVTTPGKTRDTTYNCRSKPKADYSNLADVLSNQ